ncbi:hypothetical protein [Thalassoglobus sp.]|uniref:hypothetical protein n=1 Tax=Thalassoglobus sp. TaxID=2795869 RepID=UPI003AA969E7
MSRYLEGHERRQRPDQAETPRLASVLPEARGPAEKNGRNDANSDAASRIGAVCGVSTATVYRKYAQRIVCAEADD